MDKVSDRLIVFFDKPFWVGVFERTVNGRLFVCKVTFGVEPKEYEVYEFILKNYDQLRFSPAVETVEKETSKNPKRIQREAHRLTQATGIGTKSQQAIQLQREERKTEHKQFCREMKEAEAKRMFELKQQKRKEKHRGR